jgi:hypothetical protein
MAKTVVKFETTLPLCRDPDRLAERIPICRTFARRKRGIAALAQRLMPVIGRLEDRVLIVDLRCLEDKAGFNTNLVLLDLSEKVHGLA